MASLQTWLLASSVRLAQAYPSNEPEPEERAQRELQWLLEARLGLSLSTLRYGPERALEEGEQVALEKDLQRLCEGVPLAYVLGEQPFWTLMLKVSEHTLIPRADTETLVERALNLPLPEAAEVLDLGTGTGAIALALAVERPHWKLLGVDVVPEAVALAKTNATLHSIENACFTLSHWFDSVKKSDSGFDLICSNPPYIEANDPDMDSQVARYEPASALIAAQEGLADIETIIEQAPGFLKAGGYLMIEHGWKQADIVARRYRAKGFSEVEVLKDLTGNDRATLGRWV